MRDPRVDPEPGDVLHAEGGEVFFVTKSGALKNVPLAQWRKWAGQEWVVVIQAKVKP